ncbi:hypothetical protein B0H13DRAFT_1887178 [Mycena leptocephala]|nr:hypothetical protein B0H13DRAFT_1887178 [Mycena leptocephala]
MRYSVRKWSAMVLKRSYTTEWDRALLKWLSRMWMRTWTAVESSAVALAVAEGRREGARVTNLEEQELTPFRKSQADFAKEYISSSTLTHGNREDTSPFYFVHLILLLLLRPKVDDIRAAGLALIVND